MLRAGTASGAALFKISLLNFKRRNLGFEILLLNFSPRAFALKFKTQIAQEFHGSHTEARRIATLLQKYFRAKTRCYSMPYSARHGAIYTAATLPILTL
ncbi:hypothetical protein [uncultured Campylobacter sp.]|uniref:hypothetical protein n=1 Tax=uncultured Campylobacter sp. TaxID=218934 RepID=UPI00262A0741|nr:hypothetical protein [uncultured Campylobacter sp.]